MMDPRLRHSGVTAMVLIFLTSAVRAEDPFSLASPPSDAVSVPMAVFNFDRDPLGKPPQRFSLAITGEGPDVHWEVGREHDVPSRPNMLVQNGRTKPGENFALALLDNVTLDHGEVAVKFKAMGGQEDQ